MQPKKAQEQTLPPMVDPETGLLNEQAVSHRDRLILEANARASRAEEAAQNYIREQENRDTFIAFPELNPEGEKFNKPLHNLTRSIALDSMVNPQDYGDRQLSFKQAADLAKKTMGTSVEEVKKEAAKEAIERLTPKEQASLEATGSTTRRQQALGTKDELARRTRKGDLNAIVERMRNMKSS